MNDKKYKHTIKRFAKMLTVRPDKRVTFQDIVDLRDFIGPEDDNVDGLGFKALTDLIIALATDEARIWTAERNEYWPLLVEHGELLAIANHEFDPPPVRVVSTGPRFHVAVEFELNNEKVAAWLAATGFPQISRAKEAPDVNSDVAG